ncbi:low affinity immunoglobulin epsilon Fc receptor-like isoform X6 [Anthonomus grandis grandis]|uniref:low affinity immunoglobulin epsilon Fc receptor-like isoform X6 n=1 Tax=Anthonomus grandis grandis TaxID=2921223 RepID=UPI00216596C3|nr:low affinity immunoglobulin epsilon Fc receptor-like isoform X6 [Anthonomus grandis grandis]
MCFQNTFLVFFILFSCIKVAFLLDNNNIPKTVPSNFNVKTLCEKRKKTVKAYALIPVKVTWFQAFAFCTERNMSLITIHSKEETDDIGHEFWSDRHESISDYWTAGTRLGAKTISDFVWFSDGTPFLYTNWFSDQPNNRDGTEDCVCLSNAGTSNKRIYKWHDYNCKRKKAFICESYC